MATSKKPVFSFKAKTSPFYGTVFQKLFVNHYEERDIRLLDEPERTDVFFATAYDLSYECCGKLPTDPYYGITFSGTKAQKGKTIAVDPRMIPLGSKVHVEFNDEYSYLNGWYVAEDTGSKVKGNVIDIFFGRSASREMKKFGRRKVKLSWVSP